MAEVNTLKRGRRPAAGAEQGKKRKKRRGKRTIHYILITLFLLAAGVTLSLTVFFKIESVTAVGVDKYPPEEIVAESGIQTGENLFRVNTKAVKENILKKYPYVADVVVRLNPPHDIVLEIAQCVPAAAMKQGDEFLIITLDGKVLERGLIFIPEDIPLVTGVEAGSAKPGDMLGESVEGALVMLDYLFKAAEETSFGEITNVNLADEYNMKIVYEHRLLLNLGTESELPAKLNFLKKVLADELPADAEGLIDASVIERSMVYTKMPISDAVMGKTRGEQNTEEAEPEPKTDIQEPETDNLSENASESRA